MEIGYFTMPSHPPECGLKEGYDLLLAQAFLQTKEYSSRPRRAALGVSSLGSEMTCV
jgi:hypothetical protein